MQHKINKAKSGQLNNALGKALKHVLRPLVKLMIENNIPLKPLIEELKALFVDVAEESIVNHKGKVTDSQISLMTGVHRKDVKKIREDIYNEGGIIDKPSLAAELIALWLGNPDTIDDNGNPVTLPYINKENKEFSFTHLAEAIYSDVRPRALLDEFVRQGIVKEDKENNTIELQTKAFVPSIDTEEKLLYFSKNCGDHLQVAVNNVLGVKPLLLDRSTYSDGLSIESVNKIKKLATDASMDLLHQINRKTYELAEDDKGKKDAKYRINMGAYFFTDIPHDNEVSDIEEGEET
jgi:hypothetical protein